MRLAESSKRTIEEFFKFYLADEKFRLPETKFFTGRFSNHLTSILKIHGITIGGKVFIAPKLLYFNSKQNKALPDDLIVHEITHVLQYRKEGFWRFLYKYLDEYRRNLKRKKNYGAPARSLAYFEISYEREARAAAANFLEWKKRDKRKAENDSLSAR